MRVCVLASSSGGNSIFVSDGVTRLLIDTGNLPVLHYIRPVLEAIGEDWRDLDAILVSHQHSDHLNGNTFSISLRTGAAVYVPEAVRPWLAALERTGTWPYLAPCRERGLLRPIEGLARLGGLMVCPFALPHDSDPTLGFVLTGRDGVRVGVATDLGHCPEEVSARLRDCDLLVLEANHDVGMERESGRSPLVIERNLGPWGHLSNEQCAAALCEIIGRSRRRAQGVFLAHISRECNHPDLARRTVTARLAAEGLPGVAVIPTYPRAPSALAELRRRA